MKYILTKFLIILFSALLLGGCSGRFQTFLPALPDKELRDETDKTTEEARIGWKDGCETGIAGASNTFYKMFYRSNKIDGYRMSSSPNIGLHGTVLLVLLPINLYSSKIINLGINYEGISLMKKFIIFTILIISLNSCRWISDIATPFTHLLILKSLQEHHHFNKVIKMDVKPFLTLVATHFIKLVTKVIAMIQK